MAAHLNLFYLRGSHEQSMISSPRTLVFGR